MNEGTLQSVIGAPAPVATIAVCAENAWLCGCLASIHAERLNSSLMYRCAAFDYCGIPFVEPAYAS